MMKKVFILLLCVLVLSSCNSKVSEPAPTPEKIEDTAENNVSENLPETNAPVNKEPVKNETADTDENLKAAAETPAPTPSPAPQAEAVVPEAPKTVHISVSGQGKTFLDKDIDIEESMTVLNATLSAAEAVGLPVDYSGGKSSAYIKGIGGLYEKDYGPTSGWVYSVNGVRVSKSCGKCLLMPGDRVAWTYLTELNG